MPCPGETADSADGRRSIHTQSKNRKDRKDRKDRKEAFAEPEKRFRLLTAERQAIRNRLSPARSPSTPNVNVRRSQPSHRPTCQGHVGSASCLCCLSGWLCASLCLCGSTGVAGQPGVSHLSIIHDLSLSQRSSRRPRSREPPGLRPCRQDRPSYRPMSAKRDCRTALGSDDSCHPTVP